MTEVCTESRLGEALVAEGIISQSQLDRILAEQRTTGGMLGEMLVQQGVIDSSRLLRFLAQQLGVPFCQLRHGLVDFSLLSLARRGRGAAALRDPDVQGARHADGGHGRAAVAARRSTGSSN